MAGKTALATEPDNCVGANGTETAAAAAAKTSSCRSLVPSSPRSIALYPSAAYRNLHPSASTHHLQASSTFFSDSHQRALYNARMMNALQSGAAGYDQLQFPVTFQRLQNNTDLRLGPSSSPASFSHPSMHRPHFSSFQMAHEFLECVRNVDVISDAENIKQLLKMPFDPQAEVSLIVHRIENTLLLDPFSVTQLEQHRTDWAWLQRFQAHVFQRLINRDHCSAVTKLRSETQQRNRQLLLRMLQCTIQAAQQTYLAAEASTAHSSSPSVEVASLAAAPLLASHDKSEGGSGGDACVSPSTAVIPLTLTPAMPCDAETVSVCPEEEVMPEPDASDQTPDTCYGDTHARKIIWNFEDVRMLIGTDLPIFGGDSHPCVSLRLHDMAKPITVLTGLDHWLDNLMCNVPEVAMCFHLSGIVQKYEMIKTEELPELTDSQFSPALVKDIAQNILAFLKVNTSEEGHTYWLFKKENDDVVKLYDLTNLKLGDETPEDQGAPSVSTPEPGSCPDHGASLNPFTVPAGMLFYRVAKSLLQDPDTRRRAATVTDLLHNAIKILHAHRYPEIVASAHFYIAEVLMAEDYREHEERETDSSADDYDSDPPPAETGSKKGSGSKKNKKGKGASAHAPQTQTSHSRPGRRPSDDTLRSIHLPQLCLSSTRQTFSRRYRRYRPPRLTQNFSVRCTSALSHVAQGLRCVLAKEKGKESKSRCPEGLQDPEGSPSADEEPKMARRNESIPLPYQPIQVVQPSSSQAADASMQDASKSALTHGNVSHSHAADQKTADPSTTSSGQPSGPCCDAGAPGGKGSMDRGEAAVVRGRDSGSHGANPTDETVSTGRDCGTQMSRAGCGEVRPSTSVEAEDPSSGASADGEGAVVPSAACLWVQLSSVRYGVSSLTAKLKLLLLHQAALGYKVIAAHAFHDRLFAVAADNVDLCVRCCVAVSHQLQLDTDHQQLGQDYPLMKEALGLASEIFYEWAKVWDQGSAPAKAAKKTSKKGSKKRSEKRPAGACEYNCTAAADGGDTSSDDEGLSEMTNGRMMIILERLVPQDYRAQFEMPVSPSSAYACMMLSQCYLFLEAGGRLNATSVLHADARGTDNGGPRVPLVDLTPGCSLRLSFKDEMVRRSPDIVARLADVMNEMACFQINMVQNACMCADEQQCGLLLDALAADQQHLTTAVSLFLQLGDTDNAAISLANLAKYHRLCAYFSPSRMKGAALSTEEALHHRQAAVSYRQALWHLDQHIQAAPEAKAPKRRNLLKKEAGEKKSLKSQGKRGCVSADRPEDNASHLLTDGQGTRVAYEPRQLSVEQARDLSEKLKLDLVRTFSAHADAICERGFSDAEAGGAGPVELLRESLTVLRSMLAQAPAGDCALFARNSLRIISLCSGLGREGECRPAEWLRALQSLQAALFSRRHFTAALLCATSAVFTLLGARAGNTGECVRACVTCLAQSSYVVASYIRDPASDLPLVMEDGRRLELSLPHFGLLSLCGDVLVGIGAQENDVGAGEAGGAGEDDSNDNGNSDNKSKKGSDNSCSSVKSGKMEPVGTSAAMKSVRDEGSKSNTTGRREEKQEEKQEEEEGGGGRRNITRKSRKKSKKGSGNFKEGSAPSRPRRPPNDHRSSAKRTASSKGASDGQNSPVEAENFGDSGSLPKEVEKEGGGTRSPRKEGVLEEEGGGSGSPHKEAKVEGGGSGRQWNAAVLVEFERCLRTALQKLCQVATRSPLELAAVWRGCDSTAAVAAYRTALSATADVAVADRLMSALADVLTLLAIPAAPPDVMLT